MFYFRPHNTCLYILLANIGLFILNILTQELLCHGCGLSVCGPGGGREGKVEVVTREYYLLFSSVSSVILYSHHSLMYCTDRNVEKISINFQIFLSTSEPSKPSIGFRIINFFCNFYILVLAEDEISTIHCI